MNKRQIIASLNKIANELDNTGLYKEANTITNVMIKVADEFNIPEKTFSDDADKDRIPLDKFPSWEWDYARGGGRKIPVNFDPLMPVEGQRISKADLWEKFLEYLGKFNTNVYTGFANDLWNTLSSAHNMEEINFKDYRFRLAYPKETKYSDLKQEMAKLAEELGRN